MKIGLRVEHSMQVGTVREVNGRICQVEYDHNPGYRVPLHEFDLKVIGIAPEFLEVGHIVRHCAATSIVEEVKILASRVIVTWESGIVDNTHFPRYKYTVETLGKLPR